MSNDTDGNWEDNVHGKVRQFVMRFCLDDDTFLNPSAAYLKAYSKKNEKGTVIWKPTAETCKTNASRLMRKEKVRDAIRRLLKETQTDLDEKNAYRLVRELAQMSFYNPADIINDSGGLKKKLATLGDDARCVAQITPTKYGPKVTLADRSKYMELYLRYLQLVRPEQSVEINLPVIALPDKASDDDWNKNAEGE